MTTTTVAQWSTTAELNAEIDGNDIGEGCPPGNLNNMGRSIMAQSKTKFDSTDAVLATGTIAAAIGTRIYATQAALFADLVPAAGLYALVRDDPTPTLNGLYLKVGATGVGSWSGPSNLFSGAVSALAAPFVASASASAMSAATSASQAATSAGGAAAALDVARAIGATASASAGSASTSASAAASSASTAQSAEAGTLAAIAGNTITTDIKIAPLTVAALQALTIPANGTTVYLLAPGREGIFTYSTANLSASVTADPYPYQAFYIAPSSDTSGASGAWVRPYRGQIDVKWFGALGDNFTDDTTAIQRAINYACGLNAAKLFVPAGQYVVTNLTLPVYSGPQKVIEIAGLGQSATMFGTVGTSAMPTWGSIIKSSATTGGALLKVLSSGGAFSNYHLVLRDLNLRTYDNPAIAAIDASKCSQISFYNLQVDTGVYNMQASLPTHSAAIGIITPLVGNGALSRLINCAVSGYYTGADVGEHLWGDYLNISSCLYGLLFESSNDASLFGRVAVQCCPTGIAINGAHRFDMAQLMIEHASATQAAAPATMWMAAVEDIRDVGSAAKATIKAELVIGDVGPVGLNNLVINGATGIHVSRVGDSTETPGSHSITSPASIPNNAATNLTWTSGSSGASGIQIKAGDATKLQCTIPGLYEFAIRGSFAANATGTRQVIIAVNGSAVDTDSRPNSGASVAATPTARGTALLAKNDEVTVSALQDSGGALAFSCSALSHKRIAASSVA